MIDNNLIPKYASTSNNYEIVGKGNFVRVSNILSIANFGNDILEKWKYSKRLNFFKKNSADLLNTCDIVEPTQSDWVELFECAYANPDIHTKQSAEFGTRLHDFLETYLTTGEMKEVEKHPYADVNICKQSMIKFVTDWNLGPHTTLKAECLIWSDVYKYAGCIDYVAQKDGKMYIMDWKTTGSLHTKYLLQLAAYWVALEERAKDYGLPEKVEHVYLVRFDKSAPFYECISFGRDNMLYYFEVFKSLINIYNFRQNIHI